MNHPFPVHIIGTGGAEEHLSLEALGVIDSCEVLFSSERLREKFLGLRQGIRPLKHPKRHRGDRQLE